MPQTKTRRRPGRPGSREAILDAAEALVAEAGAGHLTIDAVAARAGVSKGGVLYNFATKAALIRAMLDRLLARFETTRAAAARRVPPGDGAALRAYLAAALADPDQERWAPVLAAAAEDPRLLAPARRYYRERLAEFDAGSGSADARDRALIAWLAAEGLCFLETFAISPVEGRRRARLAAALQRLAAGEA